MEMTGSGSVPIREEDRARAWVIGGMMEPTEAPIMTIAAIFSFSRFMETRIPKVRMPTTVDAAIASPSRDPARTRVAIMQTTRILGWLRNFAVSAPMMVSTVPS